MIQQVLTVRPERALAMDQGFQCTSCEELGSLIQLATEVLELKTVLPASTIKDMVQKVQTALPPRGRLGGHTAQEAVVRFTRAAYDSINDPLLGGLFTQIWSCSEADVLLQLSWFFNSSETCGKILASPISIEDYPISAHLKELYKLTDPSITRPEQEQILNRAKQSVLKIKDNSHFILLALIGEKEKELNFLGGARQTFALVLAQLQDPISLLRLEKESATDP